MINFKFISKLSEDEVIHNLTRKKELKKCLKQLYKENFKTIEDMVSNLYGSKKDAEEVFQYSLSKIIWLLESENYDFNYPLSTYIYSLSRQLWINSFKAFNNFTYFSSLACHEDFSEELLEKLPFQDDDLLMHRELALRYTKQSNSSFIFSPSSINTVTIDLKRRISSLL